MEAGDSMRSSHASALAGMFMVLALSAGLTSCSDDASDIKEANAAERYLELVEPVDRAGVAFNAAMKADPVLVPDVRDTAADFADVIDTFHSDLQAT